MSRKTIIVGILWVGILASSCSNQKETESMPNILWVSAEDIGPAFGCYGDSYANTPHIDKLAQQGVLYTRVYATAPICAPARSALITGRHATTMGTQHLRSEIPVPQFLKTLPELLREQGYYCTNNSKTDYNFDPSGRWDENGSDAHWLNAGSEKPFFSVFNYGITHEGNTNKFTSHEVDGLTVYHDPAGALLPPFLPNTEEFRTIWAHAYDLISKFDLTVGDHMEELDKAGKLDNTIVFIFSDHGFGLPGFKRWNTIAGLSVPLVVYVPDQYKSWFNSKVGKTDERLISFVDFAPTVLKLAGIEPDPAMHGISFLGENPAENKYVYGARSRADDVYDVSRSVIDGQFMYIRNFMAYKPYIQEALIFDDSKRCFKELNRLRADNILNDTTKRMYKPKASEELYDMKSDPFGIHNLAGHPEYEEKMSELRNQLEASLIENRDIGFLHESEMMIQSVNSTPLEIASNPDEYDAKTIIEAAFNASEENQKPEVILDMLKAGDAGLRFWGLNGVMNMKQTDPELIAMVSTMTDDPSPAVGILASELMIVSGVNKETGLKTLVAYLHDSRPWVVLNAAISLRRIGTDAHPVLAEVKAEAMKYYGDVGAGYSSWMYPMFIGFALDQVIINCD